MLSKYVCQVNLFIDLANLCIFFVLFFQQESKVYFFAATAADCGSFSASDICVALPQAVVGLLLVCQVFLSYQFLLAL